MVLDNLAGNNLRTWLEIEALKLGTDSQRERWSHNVLPEQELLQLARAELFRGFEALERWSGRDRLHLLTRLRHSHRGEPACSATSVSLSTEDVHELGPEPWKRLKAIHAATLGVRNHPWIIRSLAEISVESRTHVARCAACGASSSRSSTKVSIAWAGRKLVREFVL